MSHISHIIIRTLSDIRHPLSNIPRGVLCIVPRPPLSPRGHQVLSEQTRSPVIPRRETRDESINLILPSRDHQTHGRHHSFQGRTKHDVEALRRQFTVGLQRERAAPAISGPQSILYDDSRQAWRVRVRRLRRPVHRR